jgi:glutamate-5-semialdehyde dehydrogenase
MSVRDEMRQLAREAKEAARIMAGLSSGVKNDLLQHMADALEAGTKELISANEADLAAARKQPRAIGSSACR